MTGRRFRRTTADRQGSSCLYSTRGRVQSGYPVSNSFRPTVQVSGRATVITCGGTRGPKKGTVGNPLVWGKTQSPHLPLRRTGLVGRQRLSPAASGPVFR